MTDWHSHVLPGMDDGSRSVDESVAMITALKSQGADRVIATPHFYANDESVGDFLKRRASVFERLTSALTPGCPEIIPGAEVRYYPGISRLEGLKDLRTEGSELLLLEMPFCRWTEYDLKELTELSCKSGIRILLAHIERYTEFNKRDLWPALSRSGILFQINAGWLIRFSTRAKATSFLREGLVGFVGSDCHNMGSRAPNIGAGHDIIRKKLGPEFDDGLNRYGEKMLEKRA